MEPEERRAMIVATALPLIVEHGSAVTTAKIARAAGIGEGTIFRVFPDKEALLRACLAEVSRPDETVAFLGSIPLDLPLAQRLTEAADTMRAHLGRMGAVVAALARARMAPPPDLSRRDGADRSDERDTAFDAPRQALSELFEPERDELRFPPERLADAFQRMLMAADRPGAPGALTTEELVDLFLHGACSVPENGRQASLADQGGHTEGPRSHRSEIHDPRHTRWRPGQGSESREY